MDERHLRAIPLFDELSRSERRAVALLSDEVTVEEGKQLTIRGSLSYEFFAITFGTVEVAIDGRVVAELGVGDVVGEMGAIANAPRTATVTATSPVTVLVMTARNLRHVEREMPRVHDRLQAAIDARRAALVAAR